MVGPSSSLPTTPSVPVFGKRRRAPKVVAPVAEVDPASEEDAKCLCFDKYSFVRKPSYMPTWTEFLRELRRVELRWALEPGARGVLVLRLYDHSEPGDGFLCEVKGDGSRCSPIAEFLECCGTLTQGAEFSKEVPFLHRQSHTVLRVESVRRLESSSGAVPDEEPILHSMAQYNCRGTSVNVSLLDRRTGLRTPLYHNISLQTLNYALLTSIPVFLKRPDIGVRNADFVSKNQMDQFRFAWCFLRKETFMTPVDMGELDNLLPP